jgi:hypothetical protein
LGHRRVVVNFFHNECELNDLWKGVPAFPAPPGQPSPALLRRSPCACGV